MCGGRGRDSLPVVTVASSPSSPASLTDALRALRPLLHGGSPTLDGPSLERAGLAFANAPIVAACSPIEATGTRTIETAVEPLVGAFLDGVQRSRLLGHIGHAPVVFASVAAAVRERVNRQLRTWQAPRVEHQLLVPRARIGEDAWAQLATSGLLLIDSTAEQTGTATPLSVVHPQALRSRALELVAQARERLERQLAAAWVEQQQTTDGWLWIDGGIAGNLAVDESARAFGVIKSHNTLYGDGDAVSATLSLRAGERSPVFLVGHTADRAVASWYLRLRDATNADPLFGLVRVEIAPPTNGDRITFAARVDQLSAGILLERSPVSLPDARWDTLAYGVHAVESYLHAVLGS